MALTPAELNAAQAQINAARDQTHTNIGLAQGWAQIAQDAAEASGSSSAQVATAEANRAGQQRALAETARTGAETARTGAETARTGAEAARTGAETARTGAEAARTGAETARTDVLAVTTIAQSEIEGGTATARKFISAATLKGAIQRWATGSYATAISTIGQALNRAATAAEVRSAIGAVADNDSRLSDARTPATHSHPISQVTNLQTELDKRPPIVKVATLPTNPDPGTIYLVTTQ